MSCWKKGCWGAGICTKPSNHLILCHTRLLLPSIFPSIRVFFNELALHQVPKVLELQLQHQSFQWIFRVDFLEDGLAWSLSWITALSWQKGLHNSMTPRATSCRAPQTEGHSAELWQTVVHWERQWQLTPGFLLWVPHKQYEKVK